MADCGRFYMVSRHIGLEASASKLPIYVASLPNPGLISHLISNYYQKYADAEASELASYHRKHHSEQFDVRFDFQGTLIPPVRLRRLPAAGNQPPNLGLALRA